jgi:hypothetical protein
MPFPVALRPSASAGSDVKNPLLKKEENRGCFEMTLFGIVGNSVMKCFCWRKAKAFNRRDRRGSAECADKIRGLFEVTLFGIFGDSAMKCLPFAEKQKLLTAEIAEDLQSARRKFGDGAGVAEVRQEIGSASA